MTTPAPTTTPDPTAVVSPSPTPTPPPTPTPEVKPNDGQNAFTIPEPYAKEPWAVGIKSVDDLFRQHANAQVVIGKKGVILPTEKSAPEEIQNFRKALGVPETPEGYEFQTLEELKDLQRNPELDNVVKQTLHKNGVPKAAGETIIKELEKMVFEQAKPKLEAYKEQEKAFATMKLATFGDKVEETSSTFEKVMEDTFKESAPHLVGKLNSLPAEARLATIAYAKAIHDKYVGEHKIKTPPPGVSTGSSDVKSAYQELSQAKLAVRNDTTMPKHIKEQRIQELNIKMKDIGAKASAAGIDLFA